MEKSKLSKEYKDLLKETIDNQYHYLTQEEVDSLKAYVYDAELAREVSMDWFPSSFASKINGTIIDILKQVVWDLNRSIRLDIINIDNAITLNPCIENSFNYQILVTQVGEEHAKQYVNIAIKEMKEEFGEYYDTFNQKFFKGLMRELHYRRGDYTIENKTESKWMSGSFNLKIRELKAENGDIPKFLVQVVDDIMDEMAKQKITKDDGICLNPVIFNSFNYRVMEEVLGTEKTEDVVHSAVKELRTRPKFTSETFEAINNALFNGLIPEF